MSEILLAVDTSGKNGSLSLARAKPQASEVELVESVPLAGGTFSAQLVPQISALLAKHGYMKSDLAAFAVVSGPGSFTGLRVGLAAVKALAEVLEKPIASVSLLEAIARSGSRPSGSSRGRVLAALDAGRQEVYVGEYETDSDDNVNDSSSPNTRLRESLLGRDEFLVSAKGQTVITPDASVAEILQAADIPCTRIDYPNSAVIARLGWERIRSGRIVRPEDLEANYIRRSDAEIFSQSKP